jgi:hypothetical protein
MFKGIVGGLLSTDIDFTARYEIVRRGVKDAATVIQVSETTLLEPGDLVRVRSRTPSDDQDVTASLSESSSN